MNMPRYPIAEAEDLIRASDALIRADAELIRGLRATVAKQGELITELRRELDETRAAIVRWIRSDPMPDARGFIQRRAEHEELG